MSEGDKEAVAGPDADVESKKDESGDVDVTTKTELASQLMRNPQVLAALQDRLEDVVGQSSGYIESLPEPVKRRIKALKKLQSEVINIEVQFYEKMHLLECEYAEKYAPLHEKRRDIVSGAVEPTDSDCDWQSDVEDDKDDEDEDDVKAKLTIKNEVDGKQKEADENVKGIPNFWLTTFKNISVLADMVQDHDEPIILCLKDIKVKYSKADPIGFILEFHFSDNDYFTNSVLTKKYTLRLETDPTEPLAYEGPDIVRCEGCKIDWKPNKDVTTKVIRKKQKHKGRGTTRTVNKTVQVDSFFNFFSPPKINESGEPEDEETEALLTADFEIGHLLRERVIPRAVLFFTGEAIEDDDYEEEGDEEDVGEEDDDNDPDFDPEKVKNNENCKQQ